MAEQFLQEQINSLQVTLAAQELLTRQAMDAMGDNQRIIKALHQRFDKQDKMFAEQSRRFDDIERELKDLDEKVLSREERKAELEEIVNAKVGSWVLKFIGTVVVGAAAGVTAWFQGLFS